MLIINLDCDTAIVKVYLNDDLSGISIKFEFPIKLSFDKLIEPSQNCEELVDSSTLAKLGIGSNCFV